MYEIMHTSKKIQLNTITCFYQALSTLPSINMTIFFFIHCSLYQNKEPSWYQLVSEKKKKKNSQGLTFVMGAKIKKHCFQKSLHYILLLHVDVAGRPLQRIPILV